MMFLDAPLPCHTTVASAGGEGGGTDVTALMKNQMFTNLLALAAVDEFTTKVGGLLLWLVVSEILGG